MRTPLAIVLYVRSICTCVCGGREGGLFWWVLYHRRLFVCYDHDGVCVCTPSLCNIIVAAPIRRDVTVVLGRRAKRVLG